MLSSSGGPPPHTPALAARLAFPAISPQAGRDIYGTRPREPSSKGGASERDEWRKDLGATSGCSALVQAVVRAWGVDFFTPALARGGCEAWEVAPRTSTYQCLGGLLCTCLWVMGGLPRTDAYQRSGGTLCT